MHRCAIVALFLSLPAAAGTVPVDTPAGAGSLAPGLTSLPGGDIGLTWLEPEGEGHSLKFSVYRDGSFSQARTIARGAKWFANWADTPALFVSPDGTWYAHWLEKSGPAVYAYDIRLTRSADRGKTWAPPITPHRDGTQTEHGFVSYFTWPDGQAGLAWLDGRETGGHDHDHELHGADGNIGAMTLRAALLGPAGDVERKWLLDPHVCDCCPTATASTRDGPIVVYRGRDANEIRDIFIVRREGDGWTQPRPVHEDGWRIGGCPVNGPAVIAKDDDVLAAWFTMPDGEPLIRVARSVDGGRSFDAPVELARGSALGRVDLAWMGDAIALLWMEQHGGRAILRLARFGTEPDRPHEMRRLVEVDAGRASGRPRIIGLDGHTALVVWTTSAEGRSQVRAALVELEP